MSEPTNPYQDMLEQIRQDGSVEDCVMILAEPCVRIQHEMDNQKGDTDE